MDFYYLYARRDGRISRQTFWWGALGLAVSGFVIALLPFIAMMVLSANTGNPSSSMGVASIGFLGIAALLAYPQYCLAVKRRHDRNSRGTDVLVYLVLNLLWSVGVLVAMSTAADPVQTMRSPLLVVGGYAMQGFGVYLFVVLGFLEGTKGDNAYGPDPLGNSPVTAG